MHSMRKQHGPLANIKSEYLLENESMTIHRTAIQHCGHVEISRRNFEWKVFNCSFIKAVTHQCSWMQCSS